MSNPPRPDKLPGPVKYKRPTGKREDRALYKLRQERERQLAARGKDDPSSRRGDAL